MVSVKLIHTVLRRVLSALFPERCFECGARGALFCRRCIQALLAYQPRCVLCARNMSGVALCAPCQKHFTPPNLRCDEIIVAQSYRTPSIRKAVRALKYRSATILQETLAELLWKKSAPTLAGFVSSGTVVVPVPMSAKRLRQRGFNQSALLASAVARRATLLFDEHALIKTRHTRPQSETPHRPARLANIRGAFAVRQSEAVRGKTIILVDDVITTGATIIEASRVLKNAGALRVIALVLAQS